MLRLSRFDLPSAAAAAGTGMASPLNVLVQLPLAWASLMLRETVAAYRSLILGALRLIRHLHGGVGWFENSCRP